jgi:hypothetical protein
VTKRLQVLLDESELRELRRIARGQHLTMAAWVRQVLRDARRREPLGDAAAKTAAVRAAARHTFPTADPDRMNAEIEGGYLGRGSL